jgi:hypothetical protein
MRLSDRSAAIHINHQRGDGASTFYAHAVRKFIKASAGPALINRMLVYIRTENAIWRLNR